MIRKNNYKISECNKRPIFVNHISPRTRGVKSLDWALLYYHIGVKDEVNLASISICGSAQNIVPLS